MRYLILFLVGVSAWAQPTRPPAPTNPYVRFGGGSFASGDCAKFNVFGAIISNGGPCGGSGETNTASNVGASGVGVYNAKSGVDLQFRKLAPASNKLTVVLDGSGLVINFDVVPGNILLSGLGGQLTLSQLNTSGTPSATTPLFGTGVWRAIAAADLPGTITSNTSGNAATATTLAGVLSATLGGLGANASAFSGVIKMNGAGVASVVTGTSTNCVLVDGTSAACGSGSASFLSNLQTGTTYTIQSTDCGKVITHSNAASIAVTLPQAGVSFPDGCLIGYKNTGAGDITITPTTSTISGTTSITLSTGEFADITSNGTNYEARGNRSTQGVGIIETKSRTGVSRAVDSTAYPNFPTLQAGLEIFVATAGTSTAYTGSTSPVPVTPPWVTGSRIHFKPHTNCGVTPTLAINSGTAIVLRRADASAIQAADCVSGVTYDADYDSTIPAWKLQGVPAAAGGGSGTVTSVSVVPPWLSVATATTTPAISADEFNLYETTGFVLLCGQRADNMGPGTTFGEHGMYMTANTGSATGQARSNTGPCQLQLDTGATTNDRVGISQHFQGDQLFFTLGTAPWHYGALVYLVALTNETFQIGLSHAQGGATGVCTLTSADCVALVYNSSIGANWLLRACISSTCGDTDTGVAAALATLTWLDLSSVTSGTVRASVNGSSVVTRSGPSVTRGPAWVFDTLTSASKQGFVRAYRYKGAKRLQ